MTKIEYYPHSIFKESKGGIDAIKRFVNAAHENRIKFMFVPYTEHNTSTFSFLDNQRRINEISLSYEVNFSKKQSWVNYLEKNFKTIKGQIQAYKKGEVIYNFFDTRYSYIPFEEKIERVNTNMEDFGEFLKEKVKRNKNLYYSSEKILFIFGYENKDYYLIDWFLAPYENGKTKLSIEKAKEMTEITRKALDNLIINLKNSGFSSFDLNKNKNAIADFFYKQKYKEIAMKKDYQLSEVELKKYASGYEEEQIIKNLYYSKNRFRHFINNIFGGRR